MGLSVGASFTALTVRTKLVLLVAVPSVTRRVMSVTPNWSGDGTSVTVRLAPLPSKKMFVLPTRLVLVLVAESVSARAGLSESLMVNATVRGVSSLTCWAAMALMAGV